MEKNIFELLLDKGISSIPVNSDKKPLVAWKEFQNRLPSQEECKKWGSMKKEGVAVICGAISGGLEIIDIDNKFDAASSIYLNLISNLSNERPELYDKLVIEQSKNKGYHIIYRCKNFEGNKKLARQKDLQGNILTIIETRGEGGYCIIHPSKGYDVIKNNILKVQEITEEERDYLFQLCYQFNAIKEAKTTTNYTKANTTENFEGEKIGDLYNQKDDFINVLLQHGWTIVKEENDKIHFKRPGKSERGNSATFLKEPRLFYVFSSNALPFESEQSYSPFAVYSILECNGDFKEAVKQLANEYPEFEQKTTKNTKTTKPTTKPANDNINEFWKYKNENEIIISVDLLTRFLDKNNFYYYYKDKDNCTLIFEDNNVISEVSEDFVIKFIQNYIDNLNDNYYFDNNKNFGKESIRTALNNFTPQKINQVFHNLKRREIEINKDEKGVCYKYFKNCIVKVTKNKVECLNYNDIIKKVWQKKVIQYDFTYNNNYQSCDAYRFHKLVTASKTIDGDIIYNDDRFNALRSSLGYVMHDYKSELDNKSIVFCEEQLSENGGRTGKTLTCKMLEQMGCILAKINGRKVDFSNRFLFQNVDVDTDIIQFDDTDEKFDFSGLYSILTNGLTIEKKNRTAVQLTHTNSPKIVITTNQVLTDESSSGKGRKFEVEYSDYFNDEYTPLDEFKRTFFEGWDKEEWNKFFNYMIANIQLYLQKNLIEYERVNLKNRKLSIAISDDDILDFCENICYQILTEKTNLSNKEIFDIFKEKYNNDEITQTRITRSLNKYIQINNLKAIKYTSFKDINNKTVRGFIFVKNFENSKDVINYLEQLKK